MRGECHRLERCVRKQRHRVLGAHDLRAVADHRIGIAYRFHRYDLVGGRARADAREHGLVVERGACAFVADHGQALTRVLRVPPGVGDDRDAVGDLHHVDHTGHRSGLGGIETFDRAADHRAHLDRRVDHARQLHVDAEFGRAVDLGRRVEPLSALADDGEVFRVFQRDLLGHRQLRGGRGERAVSGRFALGAQHHAVLGAQRRAIDFPLVGRGGDQHLAHLCAGQTQLFPAVAHRGRAAGELRAAEQRVAVERNVRRRDRDFDFADVDVQFFGDQHRHRGVDALPHLGARREQRDRVVVGDVHPRVRLVQRAGRLRLAHGAGQRDAEHQPA